MFGIFRCVFVFGTVYLVFGDVYILYLGTSYWYFWHVFDGLHSVYETKEPS